MQRWLSILCLLALWVPAPGADPTDLSDGVFIVHHIPELGFTASADGCELYEPYAIHSAEEQHPRIDAPADSTPAIWYVLCAWPEEKEWCGVEFGLGEFDPALFDFVRWDPCFPPTGGVEPTLFWPHPSSGTALVTIGDPWRGNFVPIYWFGGYASPGQGRIPLAVDPPTHFGGWANCSSPADLFQATCFGALGINMDGLTCAPPVAVCCIGHACQLTTGASCLDLGGTFHVEWRSCDPNPCEPISPVQHASWGRIKNALR